jgi:hypothetical protein
MAMVDTAVVETWMPTVQDAVHTQSGMMATITSRLRTWDNVAPFVSSFRRNLRHCLA